MADLSSFINRFNLVRQIPIFTKLNWFDIRRVAQKVLLDEYKKGDIICVQDSPPDYFYCLISGRLQAYHKSSLGIKTNIDFIHRGMHFGIISVLTGENHSLNIEAINDSIVLKINKNDFQALLKAVPQLGVELSQSLSRRIRKRVDGEKAIFESTIISVYSPIKGTGSSTYAINLATSLERETHKKVIFVAIETKVNEMKHAEQMQKEAAPHWKGHSVDLMELMEDQEKIMSKIRKDELNVDFLNVSFDAAETDLKRHISPFVSTLVGDYHYVIVDLPNDMDDIVLETLTQSDLVHLITHDRRKDLDLTRRVIDRLELGLKENFREEKIKVIIRAGHDKNYLSFEQINKFIDYHVYTMLPFMHQSDLNIDVNTKEVSFLKGDDTSEYNKAVKRIAREIGGVLVGLVLGGGAALGVAHVGVIRVLEQENIPIDVVVGSSMGALIGAIWTSGKNSAELEKVAREFEVKLNMLKLFDPVIPISGLIGGRMIKRWLKKHLGDKTFYNVKIPFKVVSYDLVRREEIILDGGSLVDAVRQSIAIPGVIEPVKVKDQVIIDGGVLNPLPTNVLAGLGIKKIIAVNVLQSPDDVSEGFDIEKERKRQLADIKFWKYPLSFIGNRIGTFINKIFFPNISDIIVQTLQATEYVIAEQSGQLADIVIHPDLIGIKWYELNRVDDLIKAGERGTLDHLEAIKKLVQE